MATHRPHPNDPSTHSNDQPPAISANRSLPSRTSHPSGVPRTFRHPRTLILGVRPNHPTGWIHTSHSSRDAPPSLFGGTEAAFTNHSSKTWPSVESWITTKAAEFCQTWLISQSESSELVRRRGRWVSQRTMEIYIQEVMASTFMTDIDDDCRTKVLKAMDHGPFS